MDEDIWSFLNRKEWEHNMTPQTRAAMERQRETGRKLKEFFAELSSHDDDTTPTTGELRMAMLRLQEAMAAANVFALALAMEAIEGNFPGGPKHEPPEP